MLCKKLGKETYNMLRPDEQHIQHNETEISQMHAAAQKRQEKAQERADKIARTEHILDREKGGKLKGKELQIQFKAFEAAGATKS
jgi:hypothetical protein